MVVFIFEASNSSGAFYRLGFCMGWHLPPKLASAVAALTRLL
jgi:hypothetical protein